MSKQKPYFSQSQVDCIIGVFKNSMNERNIEYDDSVTDAVEEYIKSSKHPYENTILAGVIDGRYDFICENGMAVWKVIQPNDSNKKNIDDCKKNEDILNMHMSILNFSKSKNIRQIVNK